MWWNKIKKLETRIEELEKKEITRDEACMVLIDEHYKCAMPFEQVMITYPTTTKDRGAYQIIVKQLTEEEVKIVKEEK